MPDYRICPSILNANLNKLSQEIDRIAGVSDFLHLDIMDNIFVPNLTFSFAQSEEIIGTSPIPVDVHLMIADPDGSAAKYAEVGAASVTFHYEAAQDPREIIRQIRNHKVRVGMAIKPGTSFDEVSELIKEIDMLLIMTVEPGFGGQAFMANMMPKVAQARKVIDLLPKPTPWIQVDGGISPETITTAATAGADTFVVGSAVFKSENPAQTIVDMKNLLLHEKLS
jgi:ribulose-phosphate 3-epimerase